MKRSIFIGLILFCNCISYSQNNDAFIIKKNGNFGFIDNKGELLIEPQYLDAYQFVNNLAAVKDSQGWSFINRSNERISDVFIEIVWPHEDGIALARVHNDTVVYVNSLGKSICKEYKPKSEPSHRLWSEGFHAIKQNDLWGLIDTNGAFVIKAQYHKIGDVHEGLFYAEKLPDEEYYEYKDREGNTYQTKNPEELNKLDPCYIPIARNDLGAYYDLYNVKTIDTPKGYNHFGFSEGWASFTMLASGNGTYVNRKGKLFPKIFMDCGDFHDGIARVGIRTKQDCNAWSITDTMLDACTGETVYQVGDPFDLQSRKQNYIDKKGHLLNDELYDAAYIFRNGQAVVGKDDKHGTIDRKGKQKIPMIYKKLLPITDQLFVFQRDSLLGILNQKNEIIVDPVYSNYGVQNGFILLKLNDKWGIANQKGEMIIAPKYDYITHVDAKNNIIGYYEGRIPSDLWTFQIHQLFYTNSSTLKLAYETLDGKILWKASN